MNGSAPRSSLRCCCTQGYYEIRLLRTTLALDTWVFLELKRGSLVLEVMDQGSGSGPSYRDLASAFHKCGRRRRLTDCTVFFV